jgi:cytochrome P450
MNARTARDVPAHVPEDLVRPFSFYDDPRLVADPFAALASLHDGPRIFWNTISPRHGGTWVLTRADDIRALCADTQRFSNVGQFNMARLIGESWDMVPGELDPPDLRKYRDVVGKWLNPATVMELSGFIRSRAVDLIEGLQGRNSCEFMAEFGIRFPVSVFVELMGLPSEETDMLLEWEEDIVRASDMTVRAKAVKAIADYLRAKIAERRRNPREDLISRAIAAEIDGQKLTDDRILGICFMLFTGGLDTVASSMGFQFLYLARHPEVQQRLREDPTLAPSLVEELLRAASVVVVHRVVTADTEFAGVKMAKGDWIAIPTALGSLDPQGVRGSHGVDPDRRGVRHMAFGVGAHFCLGMHLARRQLTIALEEWSQRMPPFRIAELDGVAFRGGGVFLVERLPLEWS